MPEEDMREFCNSQYLEYSSEYNGCLSSEEETRKTCDELGMQCSKDQNLDIENKIRAQILNVPKKSLSPIIIGFSDIYARYEAIFSLKSLATNCNCNNVEIKHCFGLSYEIFGLAFLYRDLGKKSP